MDIRLNGLGDCADLVNLEQKTVASLLLDGSLDTQGVCYSQVITDNLNAAVLGEVGPRFPIILVEGVLDRDDRVLLNVAEIKVSEFDARDPFGRVGVGVFEI